MHPALSVVFFTTLAGAGQGLLLALFGAQWARHEWLGASPDARFYAIAALVAAALAALGLAASFFHLGRPERAWRAASQWRTSWLSREVIVLPGFIALALLYAAAHAFDPDASFVVGTLAAVAAIALYVCTGMIYACVRFLREWASPLTLVNFALTGCASGFTLASALAAFGAPSLLRWFAIGAIGVTLAALVGRLAAWRRNARLAPKSTLQTAIGIKHGRIEQRSQGFIGGSFNTREFFHGRSATTLRALRWVCVGGAFAMPLVLLVAGLAAPAALTALLTLAVAAQFVGLLAERWLFFAEANHPQNLYYRRMS
ncbi:MAG: dimethyl sulfoxide reductase anchor subunit [Ideonella sp.]|nr:dimethyl sulfoxide reductase anchor subunit [Ideonella sp.]MCC7457157.1 dimethyl sulfoxide reductase anchor subunit [Nitrospira sp.]